MQKGDKTTQPSQLYSVHLSLRYTKISPVKGVIDMYASSLHVADSFVDR